MDWKARLATVIEEQNNTLVNPAREDMIRRAVEKGEAVIAASGCLATWTPPESTGRSPKDTVIVRHPSVEENIDWTSPNNLPLDPETFEMIFQDTCAALRDKKELYITDRVVGADSRYALPVRTVTDNALSALFTDNMFRPVPSDLEKSLFYKKGYTLLALPYDKLEAHKYVGKLRTLPDGSPSRMIVAMDFERRLGIIIGSAYMGSIKKMIFTVMNYYLPLEGILPLHCSANEGEGGETALLLGLSGTGKTTLSADPSRALLGDDEHGWSRE
nr:phosphoenolpyruvate carboxykinase (ATP) [Candidatus Mcinerneyibacteriales bacterium]